MVSRELAVPDRSGPAVRTLLEGRPASGRLRAIVAILLSAALFGTTGTAQALGPRAATAFGIGGTRLMLGAAVLALAAVRAGAPRRSWRPHMTVLLVGGAAVAAYQLAWFAGLRRTGVTLGTFVGIASCPVFAGVVGMVWGRERVRRAWVGGTAVALAGVLLLVTGGSARSFPDLTGICFMLAGGLAYAIYAQAAKRMMSAGMDSLGAMAGIFGVGAILVVPFVVVEPLAWLWSIRGSALVLHLGVFTVGVAYWLYGWGLRRLPLPTVATLTLAEPVVAALLGAVVLGERPGRAAWAGMVVVALGLSLAARPQRATPPPPAPTDTPSAGRPPRPRRCR